MLSNLSIPGAQTPNPIDTQIRQTIDRFVEEISQLVREAAVEAVGDALGQGTRAPARRSARKASTKNASPKKAKRGRRSSADLEAQGGMILEHVRANPGVRMEALSKALGQDTKDLRRPVQELIASGQLRTEGERRGTQYFAGGGGRRKATKKGKRGKKRRATKKKAA